jgi:hypothetical protein
MDGGPDAIIEGIAEEDEDEEEDDEEDDAMAASPPPASSGTSGSTTARKKLQGDNYAQHWANKDERVNARRNQIVEELKQKELGECTFQPKILNRGNPRTCTWHHDPGEGTRNQRIEQNMKTQRLKQVEAQAYADVTLRPKISRFAQAWSQRQQDQSVFERLYQPAMQARDTQADRDSLQEPSEEPGLSRSPAETSLTGAGNGGFPVVKNSDIERRIQARSDLLYNDALDRPTRRRAQQETIYMNSEEAIRSDKVLARSRLRYQQMLQRQIKAAFDEAATGNSLAFANLEDFLVRFGCMRPPRESSEPVSAAHAAAEQAAEEESKRLQAALWRHLDPNKAGHVDLLTLTVFFQVLMGAVDDTAKGQASQNLNFSRGDAAQPQGGQEEASISPNRLTSPQTSPRSDSSAIPLDPAGCTPKSQYEVVEAAASPEGAQPSNAPSPSPVRSGSGGSVLAAIFEEEGHAANEAASTIAGVRDDHAPPLSGDDEGRRACELLVRFDPLRLRAEFQQLYLHRLHYQPNNQMSGVSVIDSRFAEIVPAPEIDSQSRVMAEKLIERQKGESGGSLSQHADLLHWRHSQVEARKESRRKEAKAEEVSGCTFRPKMTAKHYDMPMEVTPRGASRNEVLYARGIADKERKEMKAQEETRARSKQEVKGCTFKPDTGKSERSYHRSHEGIGAPVPRGFYETRQRMRAANEVQSQKRQQREDRMCKITQVGGIDITRSTASASSGPPPALGEQLIHPLPVVAEDSRLQDPTRRPVKGSPPRSARGPRSMAIGDGRQPSLRGSSERVRTASPTSDGLRATTPRGASSGSTRRAASGATSRSPEPSLLREAWSSNRSPETPQMNGAPRENWGTPKSPKVREALPSRGSPNGASCEGPTAPAQFGAPASAPSSGTGASGNGVSGSQQTVAANSESNAPPPLLYVDVNIAPNQPPERIVLREGQSVAEVAADFAAKHVLTPALAQRLMGLLSEVLQRQEQAMR